MVSLDPPICSQQDPVAWQRVVERFAHRYGVCWLLAGDAEQPAYPAPVACSAPARGTELEWELRDYAPGDDPLRIDWGLCARRDELLVRTHRAPVDPRAAVLVDCSGSMLLGRPSKFELACHLAAALAAAALTRGMHWQAAGFARRLVDAVPALYGREQLGRALRFLAGLGPEQQPTDLAASLTSFARLCSRPTVVVVISDAMDLEGLWHGAGELLEAGHQVRLVQVFDPREASPDVRGEVELFDMETGQVQRAVVTERILRRYAELYAQWQESISEWCRRHAVPHLRMASNIDRHSAVEQLFRGRGASRS